MSLKICDATTSVKSRTSVAAPLYTLLSLFAILCLSMTSTSSSAVPLIDKPQVLQDKWNTIAYARVVWSSESSEQKIYCGSFTGICYVRVCMREINGTYCLADMDGVGNVQYKEGATMKQIRELWVQSHGVVSKEFRFKNASNTKCLIMSKDGLDPVPGMACRPLTAPAVSCSISDALNFEYGILAADQVDNAEAYSTLTITCNDKVTVELTLAGDRTVDLGRGGTLKASLHTTYRDLADGYSFEGFGTTTKLTIKSVLHSSLKEAEAGPFKGQAIIVMNLY